MIIAFVAQEEDPQRWLPRLRETLPRDHFVVPAWYTLRLESAEGAVLFSYTDRPVQQALGILKEERLSS